MTRWTWRTWITGAVLAVVVVLVVVAATSQDSQAHADPVPAVVPTPAVAPTPTAVAEPVAASPTATLAAIRDATTARFSVSVVDVDTGERLSYGDGSFDTASIVKVDILAALLHQHEQAGTTMGAAERQAATAMIEQSDNAAASTLFTRIGATTGLDAFNATIGLTQTRAGTGGNWGLTQTTSADQVRLLEAVLGDDSVLASTSQAYLTGLMTDVVDDQRFGVTAAADDPARAAVKVGFLQRSTTGLWDVTSIGRVQADGHTYLVAVLSDGSATYEAGVDLVDEVASAAVGALR